jgi:polyisoprenoid-binding protein YceI
MKSWLQRTLALSVLFALAAVARAEFKPLKIDAVHSRLGFTASTLLFDVDGHFNRYDVQLDGDPSKPASARLKVSIDASSIDTGNGKRDEHLSSADFFEVKKYPRISFVSESITQSGNQLHVVGTLEMHGQKRKLTIPFKLVKGKNGSGVESTAAKGKLVIHRSEFGIGADNVAAKISLEEEVTLDLLVVAFPFAA